MPVYDLIGQSALKDIRDPMPGSPAPSKRPLVLRMSISLKFGSPWKVNRLHRLPNCIDKVGQVQDRQYAQTDKKHYCSVVVCVYFKLFDRDDEVCRCCT